MRAHFDALVAHLETLLSAGELGLLWLDGEQSSFVRLNRGRVRQAGDVTQQHLRLELVLGTRHAAGTISLTGELVFDRGRLEMLASSLRAMLPHLPEDPHLLLNRVPATSERVDLAPLPAAAEAVETILTQARGHDLVGLWASGRIAKGYWSSLGQRHWFEKSSFNLGFSLYLQADKAVTETYAGFRWSEKTCADKLAAAAQKLEILAAPPKTLAPGRYRVFLAPAAVQEVWGLLGGFGAFGLKSQRTKQSALVKMLDGETLHPGVTLREATGEGAGPAFGATGFGKPDSVELIRGGVLGQALVSPRSAKEYAVPTNGAAASETPEALDLGAGDLPQREALGRLDTGIYVSNLWYLNFSDRAACRITGMTRFATLWVEKGRPVAPLAVMRFDESLYRLFGKNLEALTQERELILDNNTYERRSTASFCGPGALVRDFSLTL